MEKLNRTKIVFGEKQEVDEQCQRYHQILTQNPKINIRVFYVGEKSEDFIASPIVAFNDLKTCILMAYIYATIESVLDFFSPEIIIPAERQEFESSIAGGMNKILDSVNECIKLANVKPESVQLIVLTGGSTEIPHVRDTLCKIFPNATISGGDKLSSVGLGLAFDAARRF